MTIETITREEFEAAYGHGPGRKAIEVEAVRSLQPDSLPIRFPCRWNHKPYGKSWRCGGVTQAQRTASAQGFRIKVICRGKMVYVWRSPSVEGRNSEE